MFNAFYNYVAPTATNERKMPLPYVRNWT